MNNHISESRSGEGLNSQAAASHIMQNMTDQ